jgi:hypothetical protein
VRLQTVVCLVGALFFHLFCLSFPAFAQKEVFYYEDALGFAQNDRQELESQLVGAVGQGDPSRGRKILETWGLWPWVSTQLSESGTFAQAREMVATRNESGLRNLEPSPTCASHRFGNEKQTRWKTARRLAGLERERLRPRQRKP